MKRLRLFLRELRRRHVFRVAGIYVVAAWVVIQVADAAFPGLDVPESAIRFVWLAVFLGFPLALVFGWRYDFTSQGIVRTPAADADTQIDVSLRRTDHVILALLLMVATGVVYQLTIQISDSRSPQAAPEAASVIQQEVEPNSIAVLPLENLSGDPEQQYFVSGMQDALISNLSRVKALRVTSKTSTLRFLNSAASLPQIGAQLGVAKLIEGSIFRAGTRVRINVQLVNVQTDEHIWSESFENEIVDVLALQNEVARAIADAVSATVTLDEQSSLSTPGKVNPKAYEAFLKGQFHVERFTPEDFQKAAEYYTQAVEIDPDYALAHYGLSKLCAFSAQAGVIKPQQARSECLPPILKALQLDATLPEAYMGYAGHMTWQRFDWAEAEPAFRKALELNPSYAEARMFYSHFLTIMGDIEAGREQMDLALELDPYNPFVQALHGAQLMMSGRFEESVEVIERVQAENPGFGFGHDVLWWSYHVLGEEDKAIEAGVASLRMSGNPTAAVALQEAYKDGDYRDALLSTAKVLEEHSKNVHVGPMLIAGLYEQAGEVEKAIDWLETAVRIGGPGAPYIAVGGPLEAIQKHPRYIQLLRDMKLDYWVEQYSQQ